MDSRNISLLHKNVSKFKIYRLLFVYSCIFYLSLLSVLFNLYTLFQRSTQVLMFKCYI